MTSSITEKLRAEDWHERGACFGDNADTMYPETKAEQKIAAERCQLLCPVQELCLLASLERREVYGVWGGLTEAQRRKVLRR